MKSAASWLLECRSHAASRRLPRQRHPFSCRTISTNDAVRTSASSSAAPARNGKAKEKTVERDFFLSVLSATTTKRDAKSYLSHFKPTGVTASAAADSKVAAQEPLHVSLIKVAAVDELDDATVDGLVETFNQLSRLGLNCVIVADPKTVSPKPRASDAGARSRAIASADRLVSAFSRSANTTARRLDPILGVVSQPDRVESNLALGGTVIVQHGDILRNSLESGVVTLLAPVAYTADTHQKVLVSADDVVLALIRYLAGLESHVHMSTTSSIRPVMLDRFIVLDPAGGFPSSTRRDNAHIFVNLEQEYADLESDLFAMGPAADRHLDNLKVLNSALGILPPSASGLLTTPLAAATFCGTSAGAGITELGVQTRRPRNPLIYNLLTDKPLVSSSLPTTRLSQASDGRPDLSNTHLSHATLVKKGMPVTMVPDPRLHPWVPPRTDVQIFNIDDPRIDFPRLLNLVEDSFNRPLDVEHYMNRIRNRTAGVIIAGAYEGGAILTWELPPGVEDDGSQQSRSRMVPYLDKFAVLKRSQGAGGVADLVFSCMVRSCFPRGVCWRSRKDNPVNKWYFERSVGTWKLSDSKWTMFWTTEGLLDHEQRFKDYESVCRSIGPSWADNKQRPD